MTDALSTSQEFKLVLFHLDAQRYALDLMRVERVIPMVALAPFPKAPPIVAGTINLHGELVPVLDVRQRFRLPQRPVSPDDQLLIVRSARRKLALIVQAVDPVVSIEQSLLIEPERMVPGLEFLRGVVALPEGVVFVHDIDSFLSLEEEANLSAALVAEETRS